MLRDFHLSDEDILLMADGELSRRQARHARAHLATCSSCSARLAELESTIADFISLHRNTLDPQLADGSGSGALLRARLAELAQSSRTPWRQRLDMFVHPRTAAACALLLVGLLAGAFLQRQSKLYTTATTSDNAWIPDHTLTPGAVRPVALNEVCSMAHEEVVSDVPDSLREKVFQEYGITSPHPQDYEIDYLVAPGLGGTEDIRNLWPEPSTSSPWNAHVKDALEERLHELVCGGQLDLPTAQQAIATDWITAYKKYLGTPRETSSPNPRLSNGTFRLIAALPFLP
jgi:hypothetical protein